MQWWPKEQDDGYLIPNEFTFHLQTGTVMGGVVKNDDGQPIKGVQVEVRYDQGAVVDPSLGRAQFDAWLSSGILAVRTDADGRWTLRNVPPGDDVNVMIKLSHRDYVNDQSWGQLQREQSLTAKDLPRRPPRS